jgi:hypothetical protein
MSFLRYPHLERFGNTEVQDIEFGVTHIFPKLDGTNASVWYDNTMIRAGSRNRQLNLESDNAGFYSYILNGDKYGTIEEFCLTYPNQILYGEWLVPHTIKNYREDAWRRFWIFDVYDKSTGQFLPYEVYQPLMEQYGLDYIPCIKIFKNGSYDNFLHEAQNNAGFLLPQGAKPEGIVIKNYNWTNKHQKVTWAKIVLNEFKDEFHKAMGPSVGEGMSPAQVICDLACSPHLIEKEYAKIVNHEHGWSSHFIPRLLHTVFYSVVTEELWDSLKKINYGSVNFQELKALCIQKVKQTKPELF